MRFRLFALFLFISCVTLAQSPFTEVPIATDSPVFVMTDDINRDGNLDLLAVSLSAGTVSILHGDGQGHFSMAPGSPISVGPDAIQVATGDFNQDGRTDIAVMRRLVTVNTGRGSGVSVFFGTASGFTPYSGNPLVGFGEGISFFVRDVDADGDLDILVMNGILPEMFPGDGTGNFGARTAVVSVGAYTDQGAVGDLNGDGNVDLAILLTGRYGFRVWGAMLILVRP